MEEAIPVVAAILVSLISALAGIVKQAARRKSQDAIRAEEIRQEATRQELELEKKKQESAGAQPFASAFPAPARMNGEGKDDCHAYMLDASEETASSARAADDGEAERMAQELVRGVIISEILNRPRPGYGRRSVS